MPSPKCVSCSSINGFELKEIRMHNAEYRHYAVACRNCGGVAGVIEFFNIGAKVVELTKLVDQYGKRTVAALGELAGAVERAIRKR